MTVTAPPRPPQPRDSAEWAEAEALIAEARQRARRRRRRYAAAATLLALVAASAIVVSGARSPRRAFRLLSPKVRCCSIGGRH